MLTVWGRRSSFNLQKVMWLVDELALPHRHIEAGGAFGGLDTPAFRQMNPHGKIPVIKDGEVVVWESHAILRYLAACYGGDKFWPSDPASRSQADRWMDWSQTTLQRAFLGGVFWGFYRTPAPQRDLPAIEQSITACAAHFQLLDILLTGRHYMLGETLTLADIAAGTNLYRYFNVDIERPYLPNVKTWYRRLQDRPAYRQHVMVPFEELFGRLDF